LPRNFFVFALLPGLDLYKNNYNVFKLLLNDSFQDLLLIDPLLFCLSS